MAAKHRPNDKTRIEVVSLASFGITQDKIADYLEIDDKTLRKYYRRELDTSAIRANAQVAKVLYEKAVNDRDTTSCIFWLKTRAGWKEPKEDVSQQSVIEKYVIDKLSS